MSKKLHTKNIPRLGALKYKRTESQDIYYLFDVSAIIQARCDAEQFYHQFGSQHVIEDSRHLISDKAMMKWLTSSDSILTEEQRQSLYHVFVHILSCWQPKTPKTKKTSEQSVNEYVQWKASLSQQEPMTARLDKIKNPFLYVDRFLLKTKLHSLLQYKVFPNIKEISESMSAYYAVKTCLEQSGLGRTKFGDQNIKCYVVADGSMPRTGGIFVLHTNWSIYSIDPMMKNTMENKLDRLSCHTCTAEDFTIPESENDALSVVVAVHSHADFNAFWQRLPSPKIGIAIPCCVEQFCDGLSCLHEYDDDHILSAAKHIKMWYQQ
jgi:hypothetical protein